MSNVQCTFVQSHIYDQDMLVSSDTMLIGAETNMVKPALAFHGRGLASPGYCGEPIQPVLS